MFIKVYKGFGHAGQLVVMGHLLSHEPRHRRTYRKSIFRNLLHLVRLFTVRPLGEKEVCLHWYNQRITTRSAKDGFFRIEWNSDTHVEAGFHDFTVTCPDAAGQPLAQQSGQLFVPHITQLGIISDIDDTFLVSYSATILKRLYTLFTLNAHTRKAFENVSRHYQLLEQAQTTPGMPNPFFYVSSSEWNLYDYLREFTHTQQMPEGIFLLSQLKRWYQLFKTGKTKHEGKFARIVRVMETFPNQQFILLGDNTQKDPEIYSSICRHFPNRIRAVYIRMVVTREEKNVENAYELETYLESMHIPCCLFAHSREAIEHSQKIGIIKTLNAKR